MWSADGQLVRAFYGPTEYGGGGVLDPRDPSVFFYKGLEFALDWQTGTDSLKRVFARPDPILEAHYGPFSPDTPLYPERPGRRYFTSCFTHNPVAGDNVAFIWLDTGKAARLVAACGDAHAWRLREKPCAPPGPRARNPRRKTRRRTSTRSSCGWIPTPTVNRRSTSYR